LGEVLAAEHKMVYNLFMAKRDTGVGKMKRTSSNKTTKRLEAKKAMLAINAIKHKHRSQKHK
jgi:hypothetical protein